MNVPRARLFSGASLLLLAGVLAACNESPEAPASPVSPSFAKATGAIVPFSIESVNWDFAAIIPGTGDPEDLGTTETINLTDHGSIEATTGGDNEHITVKGRSLPVGATERGMGLCLTDQVTCTFPDDGDEVGDGGPGALLLNFDGVEPAGSQLDGIDLGSLQTDEGYRYSYSTDGGATFNAPVDVYPNDTDLPANATLVLNLPTAGLVVKLEKAPVIADNDDDYTVKSVTTSYTTQENLQGRMTGGGVKAMGDGGEVVTLGLTLHCDILLSNNLEINWGGHQWHLAKPITSAICTDEPNIAPPPPAAPIDTFEGTAYGRLDGVGDSFIEFRFQDAGEPGRDDTVELTIYEPGSMSNVALHITAQKLSVGNFQMHYDQPHGQKP